ncbi:9175_t:CDS:2, partial [Rhizophagus irregularis]
MFFVATDQPVLSKILIPKSYILAPVVKISSKYAFSITCEYNYLDLRTPTDEDRANCNKYIVPTECKEQDPNNVFVGHCVGLFNPPIQDKFNFSLPDKRYGISFLITITDEAYNATDDNGMQVRVYDQLFNPSQLSDSVRKIISRLDPYFLDRLENLNFHVMGYHQVNKMYVSRKTKRFQIPTFFSVLGIPPTYFPQPFIESNYESVQIPGVVSSFTRNTYGSLFVGTLDWTEEIQTELRSSNVLDSFALLSAFYGLLVGVYVCLFGWSAILPWGICQTTCCKRKSKSNLREKFPRGIPIISPLRSDQPKLDRLEALEKFIKLFLVNVEGQAKPESKPPNIEDGEEIIPDKEKPKFRPLSFLSVLNTAPMTRPNSRPQTRPVSTNTQENEVTPNVPPIPEAKGNLTTANAPPNNRLSFFLSKFPKSESPGKKTLSPNDTLSTTNDLPTESETGISSSAPNNKVPNSTNLPTGSGTDISPAIPYTGAPDGKSSTSKNLPTKSETGGSPTAPNKIIPDSKNLPTGSGTDISPEIPYTGAPDGKSSASKNLPTKSETGASPTAPNKIIPDSKNLPTGSGTDISPEIPYTGAPDGKSSASKNLPAKSETGASSTAPNKKLPEPIGSDTDILSAIPYIGAPDNKSSTTKNLPTKSETDVPSAAPNKIISDNTHLPNGSGTDISPAIPYTGAPDGKSSASKNLPTKSETGASPTAPNKIIPD